MRIIGAGIVAGALALGACGNTATERGITGGALGAAVGGAGAEALDQSVVAGALLGGALGAGVGVATSDRYRDSYGGILGSRDPYYGRRDPYYDPYRRPRY